MDNELIEKVTEALESTKYAHKRIDELKEVVNATTWGSWSLI